MSGKLLQTPQGALAGIRVIDLSQVAAGPYGTSLMGDLGADVLRVEQPQGEPFRSIDNIFGPGESAYYYGVNHSKRCIAIDLASDAGQQVFKRLIETADVFVVAFRPSATRKLGLTYERLSEINPRLIYCSITAFGETGPLAEEPGMDILAQALSGIMALTGEPDRPPVKVGPPIADFVVSYLLGFAVCAALRARDRDGIGQKIELNLLDGLLASVANYATPYMATRKPIRRIGGGHPQIVPYQVFAVADGFIVLACVNDRFWPAVCEALGSAELAANPSYRTNPDRVGHREELVGVIEKILIQHPRTYWIERLKKAGVPCSAVNELEDALTDPQVVHNRMTVELDHPKIGRHTIVNNPIKMSRTMPQITGPGPGLGEHTKEILRELGYSDVDIAALLAKGAVSAGSS
ncbi:MAG: CoA transferase [Betaproteobacteria bacterium]|nr:CoA transferase [Betaproteobacteria bacterium]